LKNYLKIRTERRYKQFECYNKLSKKRLEDIRAFLGTQNPQEDLRKISKASVTTKMLTEFWGSLESNSWAESKTAFVYDYVKCVC